MLGVPNIKASSLDTVWKVAAQCNSEEPGLWRQTAWVPLWPITEPLSASSPPSPGGHNMVPMLNDC